jgi:hypothetical protein
MTATNGTPQDAVRRDDLEPQAAAPGSGEVGEPAAPPFDWQVLLLRYLPQPVGSTHVIKRLAPR